MQAEGEAGEGEERADERAADGKEDSENMTENLQHLKALQRASQDTLALRFYLPKDNRVIQHNQVFDGFAGIIINYMINKLRLDRILNAAGGEEEYLDRRIMKASLSWNKFVTYGTNSTFWDFMGLKCCWKNKTK